MNRPADEFRKLEQQPLIGGLYRRPIPARRRQQSRLGWIFARLVYLPLLLSAG